MMASTTKLPLLPAPVDEGREHGQRQAKEGRALLNTREHYWRLGNEDAKEGKSFRLEYDGWEMGYQQAYEEGRLSQVIAVAHNVRRNSQTKKETGRTGETRQCLMF